MPLITTLSFYRFRGTGNILWALRQNQSALRPLSRVEGLRFYKLMGSGSEGYSTYPDWKVYAILQVWESRDAAKAYFETHPLASQYKRRSENQWRLYMKLTRARGSWGGGNPFGEALSGGDLPDETTASPIAVLTRATIRKRHLLRFWRYVPYSQLPLAQARGLLFHKGIGEVPFLQMATFSLWESEADMKRFAYKSENHQGAIAETRRLDWYREELFARFIPVESSGYWPGVPDLLRV